MNQSPDTRSNLIAKPTRGRLSLSQKRRLLGIALLLPAFLSVAVIILYPMVLTLQISFQKYSLGARPSTYIGFDNYNTMLNDPDTLRALLNSVFFTVAATVFSYLIGLGLALLLNRQFRGRVVARTLLVLPWAIPGVVAVSTFRWMFDSNFGVINYFLLQLGWIKAPLAWLAETNLAAFPVLIVMIWKGYPFLTLMLLAGLQSIPNELYEAAKVDGANAWQRFRYISFPGLSSVNAVAIILTSVWIFRDFDIVYLMTGGGPAKATQTLGIQIFTTAFDNFDFGYASVLGIVSLVICIGFSVVLFRRQREFNA